MPREQSKYKMLLGAKLSTIPGRIGATGNIISYINLPTFSQTLRTHGVQFWKQILTKCLQKTGTRGHSDNST